ncbi:MAG: 4-hydroxy-tetrahydrodipicolinate reductase [bacterium]
MIKLCISGAGGKMGSAIINCCKSDGDVEIGGLLEKGGSPAAGKVLEGIKVLTGIEDAVKNCDCLIEFTNSQATLEHLAKISIPAVVGTTAFSEEQIKKIGEFSKKIPVVLSPNMSKGVNLLFSLSKTAARKLPGYEVEIIEAHHNRKKDAPSGTAKKIAEIINEDKNLKFVYGREGNVGARKQEEIGIHAVRAGDIVGEHTVIFAGPGECFELVHKAYSRNCFAQGAIAAAKWLVGKSPALYTMSDVLGI